MEEENEQGNKVKVRKFDLGGVYETFFTEHVLQGPIPPQQYLEVLDYSIAFRFTQCDTERLGRCMNLMKPCSRASLGDKHFAMSVFVAYNAPELHDIDFNRLVRCWEARHKRRILAVQLSVDKANQREREVLTRRASEHKHTFVK